MASPLIPGVRIGRSGQHVANTGARSSRPGFEHDREGSFRTREVAGKFIDQSNVAPGRPRAVVDTTDPEVIGRDLRTAVAYATTHVTAYLVEFLWLGTPMDTTNARNNWITSVGSPYSGVDGTRLNPSNRAQASGLRMLKDYRIEQGPTFVSNNVDYIEELYNGWSPQAASGWVDHAVEDAVDKTNRVLSAVAL